LRLSRFTAFLLGLSVGTLATYTVIALLVFRIPDWLVLANQPEKAEVGVVLGGGGGSRLRAGLSLYDAGFVSQLLLVDGKKSAWEHIQKNLCLDCAIDGKDVRVLEGSTNTLSDAELVEQFCLENRVSSLLIITDPYHTRRASLIFHSRISLSQVNILVVSSGDYANYMSPEELWWTDESTLQVVLAETSKIAFMFLKRWV